MESVKIDNGAVEDAMSDFELDLIAVFSLMMEDVVKTLNKGVEENRTPDEIINDIERLI